MIIKEYTTNISCIIPIIDIEIGNQICRNNVWYYGESDIITFGRIYQNKIIILQREKTDDMDNLITFCADCNESIGNRKYNPPKSWIGYKIYPKWKKLKGGI